MVVSSESCPIARWISIAQFQYTVRYKLKKMMGITNAPCMTRPKLHTDICFTSRCYRFATIASRVVERVPARSSGGDNIGAVVSLEPLLTGCTIWHSIVPWIFPSSTSRDFGGSIRVCASDFPVRDWSVTERFSTNI